MAKRILNEIKTADAYQKFYSDIDNGIYDVVTFGSKNLLNISKFILDYFKKSGREYTTEIIEAIRKIGEIYGKMDNQSQVEVNNKAKMGQYASFEDLYQEFANKEDAVTDVEGLKYGPSGLIILLDDDELRITCAPTYEAEQKNFGQSRWCTASDVYGRYNGYYFFAYYTFFNGYGLDGHSFNEMNDYERVRVLIDLANKTGVLSALVQINFKQRGQIYQAKVNLTWGINFNSVQTVCDFYDEEYDWEDVEYDLDHNATNGAEKFYKVLNDNKELIAQSIRKSIEPEYAKMKKMDDSVRQKAEKEVVNIKNSVSSFIEQLASEGINSFYEDIRGEINDDDEYMWYNNTLFINSDETNFGRFDNATDYTILTFILGGNSKKLNNYMLRNNMCVYVTVLFNSNDEIISYTVNNKEKYYYVYLIDGVPYCVNPFHNENSEHMANICNSKFEVISTKYYFTSYYFHVFSDVKPNWSKDSCVTADRLETYYKSVDDVLVYLGDFDEIKWTGNYANAEFFFKRKDGTMVRTDIQYIKALSTDQIKELFKPSVENNHFSVTRNDVATMVRECIEALLKANINNKGRL